MILVDKDIKDLVRKGQLIIKNYNENNVKSISYDLTLDKIISPTERGYKKLNAYELSPNSMIYIKMKERLHIPENILGRIAEKNSIMRMGLVVSGSHYQPGHKTDIFIRVHNISTTTITLKHGESVAQIIFEQLNTIPDITYDKQSDSSFNEEFNFKYFGKYEDRYSKLIHSIETSEENLAKQENRIYGNIITLMGIFISIFSVINSNLNFLNTESVPLEQITKYLAIINLSLLLVLYVLFHNIFTLLNRSYNRKRKQKNNLFIIAIILVTIVLISLFG